MKIVITNDDGHDAPGLAALYEAGSRLGEVLIVAPEVPQSGVGHCITLKDGVFAKKVRADKYVVQGSPADCARLAIKVFAPDAQWLISGINPGANLGTDIYPSGTVAAAREAAILGRKSIALSQYIARDHSIDWSVTTYHALRLLPVIMGKELGPGQYWNVNFPHSLRTDSLPAHQLCEPEKQPHDYIFFNNSDHYYYDGSIHDRPRAAGSDVDVCFSGHVAVTRMQL